MRYIIHPMRDGGKHWPDPDLNRWLEDNDLDPWDIVADHPIVVCTDAESISVQEFMFEDGPDGRRRKKLDAHGGPMKAPFTYPLKFVPDKRVPGFVPTHPRRFVDLRFWVEERQDFPDEEPYLEVTRVTRSAVSHVPERALEGMGEDFAQNDRWQLFFANQVPGVLSDGGEAAP